LILARSLLFLLGTERNTPCIRYGPTEKES
jgi:hypothetical protein